MNALWTPSSLAARPSPGAIINRSKELLTIVELKVKIGNTFPDLFVLKGD
ncbi:hypothetical protein SCG7109_AI_00020 [Chlamydiales bacterium SCGC AG-110-M15]|nr:hypothetical protein SCG7109_AI_00020 [Chlamydiales bacterium SCGC AG-110-M15]